MALLVLVLAGGSLATVLYVLRQRHLRDLLIMKGFALFLRIARLELHVKGRIDQARPLLLVSNHVSYMDIPIIASLAPVRFTPKSEIANWPVIGFFCRVSECVFIDRKISSTGRNKHALEKAFRKKQLISLFAEGTTGDGKRILPFRSSYFSLAMNGGAGASIPVQPATLRYTRVNGIPVDSVLMPKIAWYGDMYLLPHILEFLKLGKVRAELTFHEVLEESNFSSRKDMAAHCQKVVQGET